MFEWIHRLRRRREKWVLHVSDRTANTAKLTYGGREIAGVTAVSIELHAGGILHLSLCISPEYMHVLLGTLDLLEIVEVKDESS